MSQEISPVSVRAYGRGCTGCRNHQKEIMLTFMETGTKFTDVFLDTAQAEDLVKEIQERLAQNTEPAMELHTNSLPLPE